MCWKSAHAHCQVGRSSCDATGFFLFQLPLEECYSKLSRYLIKFQWVLPKNLKMDGDWLSQENNHPKHMSKINIFRHKINYLLRLFQPQDINSTENICDADDSSLCMHQPHEMLQKNTNCCQVNINSTGTNYCGTTLQMRSWTSCKFQVLPQRSAGKTIKKRKKCKLNII